MNAEGAHGAGRANDEARVSAAGDGERARSAGDARSLPRADFVVGARDPALPDVWRCASRAVIVGDDGLLTLITTPQYGELGFPGGRENEGEGAVDALVREVREETGHAVDASTARLLCTVEVVRVHQKEGGANLRQLNRYFLCAAHPAAAQSLDAREAAHGIDVVRMGVREAIRRNEQVLREGYRFWVDRDLRVLRLLASCPPDGVVLR